MTQMIVNWGIDYLPELELLKAALGMVLVFLVILWLACGLWAWEVERREEERRKLRAWKRRRQLLEKEQWDESYGRL